MLNTWQDPNDFTRTLQGKRRDSERSKAKRNIKAKKPFFFFILINATFHLESSLVWHRNMPYDSRSEIKTPFSLIPHKYSPHPPQRAVFQGNLCESGASLPNFEVSVSFISNSFEELGSNETERTSRVRRHFSCTHAPLVLNSYHDTPKTGNIRLEPHRHYF